MSCWWHTLIFLWRSVIVSFSSFSIHLKSIVPTSCLNDTFRDSLQKNIIEVSSKCHRDFDGFSSPFLAFRLWNALGTFWILVVPTWGKHRAPHGQASCPSWASTVPIYWRIVEVWQINMLHVFAHFRVRRLLNSTTAWNATRFIGEIFRELLAYLKYFDEFCINVVRTMVWT